MDVESLHASATKITGLTDFGDSAYLEGLSVLLASYEREAGLTELGYRVKRAGLRTALVARLLSEAAWQRHPGYASVPIERPIFVTGLPRTGTTALHRLLTEDPAHQGLELWLTDVPQPRPPRETWDENPMYQRIQAGYEQHHVEHPEFMGLHYITADMAEECWRLLRQSMLSVSFECLAYIPGYSAWLAEQDWSDAYHRHRRNLQLIGMPDAQRRWVLKNPSHLFALDALMDAYPDALVIQTHRPPRTIIASMCSLAEQAAGEWSTVFRGPVIGETQLELWARGLEKFTADRAKHNPAQFFDVRYDDFVADPLGVVTDIYRHFGMENSDETLTAMKAVHSSGDRRRSHRYDLADFGLTVEQVEARFSSVAQ
ncbi:sulfotransferase [Kibdelosporangium persicum]|uniref:Sulfotransferase n=1 Tax=Kibdelosporangium persicum TaxID=2698649 RepID=A0ABX2F468_9PSEU|nr:sulfotransferase [Kibdelosporangium persicum]NRN65717.1 Sulfotransferase [Kibdelosporangium persicum]